MQCNYNFIRSCLLIQNCKKNLLTLVQSKEETVCHPSTPQVFTSLTTLPVFKPFSYVLQYIGSLEVGRPGSRMEIVAAMRRIRVRFPWSTHTLPLWQNPLWNTGDVRCTSLCTFLTSSFLCARRPLFTHKWPVCVKLHSGQIQWAVRSSLNQGRIRRAAWIFWLRRDTARRDMFDAIRGKKTTSFKPPFVTIMQGRWKQHAALSLNITAVWQRHSGRKGFSCLSAVASNLTTKFMVSLGDRPPPQWHPRKDLILIQHPVQWAMLVIWSHWQRCRDAVCVWIPLVFSGIPVVCVCVCTFLESRF